MAGFLKVLFRNLLEGPSTDPFPLGETFTPARLRGRAKVDPTLCMGCGVCRHVCAAGAINITHLPDGSGYTITIWTGTRPIRKRKSSTAWSSTPSSTSPAPTAAR